MILFAGLLLATATYLQAQEYGLYQMREVWNASHLNPGFFPRQQYIFSLPSAHTSFNVIGLNKERLFEYDAASDVNYLNFEGVLDGLDRDLALKNSTILDGIGLGGRWGKFFVSLSTSSVAEVEATLPEALLRTVWEGTEAYLDTPLEIGPSLNMIAYQKIGFGISYEVTPRLSLGGRLNRLLGAGSFVTERSILTLSQSSDIYQTTAELDYQAYYYGAGQLNLLDATVQGFENFGEAIDGGSAPGEDKGLRQYTNRNAGWSFDFGAEYLLGDRLTLSASLLNLGTIRWASATQQVGLTGTAYFEGVDAANLEDEDFEVLPGIDTVGTFEAVSNVAYNQSLSPRSYFGLNYQLLPYLDVGGLLYNEFFEGGTFTAVSLSARARVGQVFSLGGMYTLQNGTFNSLGANLSLQLGPVQVYGIADNLSAMLTQERLHALNCRVGLNLAFGRKKADQRLAAARGLEVEVPFPVSFPAPAVAEADTPAPEAEPLPQTRPAVPEEEPQPHAPPTPAIAEEPTALQSPKPAPEARVTEPAPQQSVSATEPATLPPNHPASAEGLRLFPVRLELRDEENTGLIGTATLDIYRIETGGFFKLIRTEATSDGHFDIQLSVDRAPYQAVLKASGYDSLIVDFQPSRKERLQRVLFLQPHPPAPKEPNAARPAAAAAEAQAEVPAATAPPAKARAKEPTPAAPNPATKPAPLPEAVYLVTKRTSLREQPDSQSQVISRLPVDTELRLIEKTNRWWWKVSRGGWEGYVKAALVKLRE